jgi:hypothetical protein
MRDNLFGMNLYNSVLPIPYGRITGVKALEADSEVLIFADAIIADASKDDYVFPIDCFKN